MEEKQIVKWLCDIPQLSHRAIRKLFESLGTPQQVYEASQAQLSKILTEKQLQAFLEQKKSNGGEKRIEESFERMQEMGIGFVWFGEMHFPQRLRQIPDAPVGLFYRGNIPDNTPSVAVIGARDCSAYGKYVAEELGSYLGKMGIDVISGMARGIDGISQMAAMEAAGKSFGVLGSGVDVCYPQSNRKLYHCLCEKGGILSAYPPGTMPQAYHFPHRNRIVSGLSDAIVVIEARLKSGTLITVDMALEQGKDVYVVPGRVTDRLSDGCNKLIKQGAQVFLTPGDFVEDLLGSGAFQAVAQGDKNRKAKACEKESLKLSAEEQRIYELLDFTPKSMGCIAEGVKANIPIAQVNIVLMELCMKKYASQISPGFFVRDLEGNRL